MWSLSLHTPKSTPIHTNNHFSKKKKQRGIQIRSMRAVVQRVSSASVEVEGRIVSEIGPGLLVLVGVHESDVESDSDYICRKVLNMRLFSNEKTGRAWDQNVMQRDYGVLLVSQFTLYGILKGNKPDFHVAMPPQKAKPFYDSLVEKFRKSYNPDSIKVDDFNDTWTTVLPRFKYMITGNGISKDYHIRKGIITRINPDGVFGAMMKVNLVNDGPVTMQLDSSQPSKNKSDLPNGELES